MVASGDGADRSTDVLMADGDSQIAVQVCELRREGQARGSMNNRLAQIGAPREALIFSVGWGGVARPCSGVVGG